MLPLKNRLKKKKDFERIFNQGKSFKHDCLVLRILENDLGYNRFGFVVSKKVSKKAVVRNRIKRMLREIVRQGDVKIKEGFDIVVIALIGIENKKFQEIKKEFLNLILKTKIL